MNPSASSNRLRREMDAIEVELAELDRRDAQLRSALGDLEHDLRRCTDALERAGWHSGEGEARHGMLSENRKAIDSDRALIRTKRAQLRERLQSIQKRMTEDERNG